MDSTNLCPPSRGLCVSPVNHRSRKLQVSSSHVRHPVEPLCTYDPVEGLVLAPETIEDPTERVRLLEAQISR